MTGAVVYVGAPTWKRFKRRRRITIEEAEFSDDQSGYQLGRTLLDAWFEVPPGTPDDCYVIEAPQAKVTVL